MGLKLFLSLLIMLFSILMTNWAYMFDDEKATFFLKTWMMVFATSIGFCIYFILQ